VGNCDAHAEQNISFINETKFVQDQKVDFKKSFKLYCHRSLKFQKFWTHNAKAMVKDKKS
jgi:hypothetical protein